MPWHIQGNLSKRHVHVIYPFQLPYQTGHRPCVFVSQHRTGKIYEFLLEVGITNGPLGGSPGARCRGNMRRP